MKIRLCGLMLVLGFLAAGPAYAQEATILGTVTNSAGEALSGVQVFVEGLSDQGVGTITNDQGRYRLRVPESLVRGQEATLVAQYLGYSTGEESITVNAGTITQDFVLAQTALSLDEIVVTGVVDPVQGKKLPFTVGKVSQENIATVPATGAALSSLQGKVAGVNMTRPSGQPGRGVSVQLRTPTSVFTGNEPLYVVDGVILGSGTIDIEALDIESIEVVKGAAAASLYGSRAAAGVIQIRTARGGNLALGRTRFTLRTEAGLSQLPRRVPTLEAHWQAVYEGTESYVDEYGRTVNPGDRIDRNGNLGCRPFYPNCFGFTGNVGQIADNTYTEPIYDHLGEFYDPGRFLTQSVTVTQNAERTNFLASANIYDEAGAIPGQEGYERYNFRVNLDHRILDNLTLSFSGYHNRSDRDDIDEGESGATGQGPFFQLMRYRPEVDIGKKDASGNYLQFPDSAFWQENPLFIAATRDNFQKRARTLGNLTLQYSPTTWLRVSGQYSYDRLDRNDQNHLPAGTPINPFSGNPETYPAPGLLDLRETTVNTQNGMLSTTLSRPFGEFNPRLTFSGSFETRDYDWVQTRGEDFAVWGTTDVNLARDRFIASDREEIKANGYFADLALDYGGKYIGSFLVRRDGSSLFGPDERWQTYYRAALAYRMNEEPWWPTEFITEFKPRYSIGTAGNRPNFAYQYETWNVGVSADGETVTFSRGTLGNRELKPEFATEQEFGVDVAVLDRYLLQLTYATQRTEDLILRLPQRAVTGYSFQWNNVGAIEGNTFEASLEASLIQTPDLSWNATVVLDRSTSEITDWPIPPLRDGIRIYQEGGSLYDIYGSRFLTSMDQLAGIGIPQEDWDQFQVNDEGYVVYVGEGYSWRDGRTENEDGRVLWLTTGSVAGQSFNWGRPIADSDPETGEQRTHKIGDMQPDFGYGFMSNLRWKGASLHAHFRGQVGGDIYNYTRQRMYRLAGHGDIDQRGKPEETKKNVNYYRRGLFNDDVITSEFVEDGSFLKLQALQVAYTFGRDQLGFLGQAAPESLKLGVTGRNLFTLTDYTGYDPDVGTVLNRYDAFGYPNLRQLTATMEITF